MRFRSAVSSLAILFLLLVAALPARGQVVNATLNGHVQDSSGGAIPGASVTASNEGTSFSRSATASGEGEYNITALPPGTYTVTATAKGFKKEAKSVTLFVGQAATVDFILSVGETTQQVTVEATTEVTEPTRTQVSTVIQERQIKNLPVNGRQFIDFALLSPAVQIGDTTAGGTDVIVEPVTKLSFAGQNINYNFIAVDGADDISTASGIQRGTPPQESVKEFRVINTSYSSEMGRAVGGIVNIITKSGTNEWHGTLYEYFRNNSLDAKSILAAPGLNTLRQNQFGAAIGGPLKKDRTFIFANYEGQRRGESPFYNSVVLANIAAINNVKTTVFGLPPEPAGLNVLRTGDYDNGFVRLDHNFSDHETLMVRYFVNDGRLLNQSPLNDGFDLPSSFKNNFINDQSVAASLTSVLSPTIVNELRGQFARRNFNFPVTHSQPHLEVANTFTTGVNRGNPDLYIEKRGEIVDNVTINVGKNTVSFGGNFNYVVTDYAFPLFYPFEADFPSLGAFLGTDGVVANCPTAPACPHPFLIAFERFKAPNFTEPTLANFAQIYAGGAIPSAIRDQARGTLNHTYNGLYIQDKWRATTKLTINYGFRWDFETWPAKALNSRYKNFDPRVGIAYLLGGNWNWTVRAGSGLFHGIIPERLLACQIPVCGGLGKFPGFSNIDDLDSTTLSWAFAGAPAETNAALMSLLATGTYTDAAPVPAYVTGPNKSCPVNHALTGPAANLADCIDSFFGPSTIVRFDKNHKNPYGIQTSLSVEFDPVKDTTVSITYMRTKGVHLGSFFNINQPLPSGQVLVHNSGGAAGLKNTFFITFPGVPPGVPGTACINQGLPCPHNYALYFFATSRWNSNFNGLLLNVNKRLSHHFSAGISYTYSHTIDDGPNPSFVLIPQDNTHFGAEKANSADDIRHRFVGNAVLSSPTTGSMWFRDFQLGTIVTLQSPEWFTKFAGFDANGDIFGMNDRVGIEGRDTFRGRNFYTFDLRLSRSFAIHEKQRLELIAEGFNLFNHVNIKYFNTVYGAADFCPFNPAAPGCPAMRSTNREGSPLSSYGTPRAIFNPRQLQLAARFSF